MVWYGTVRFGGDSTSVSRVPRVPCPSRELGLAQVDERHAYLCAAAPLKEDMDYIRNALLTASFKVT